MGKCEILGFTDRNPEDFSERNQGFSSVRLNKTPNSNSSKLSSMIDWPDLLRQGFIFLNYKGFFTVTRFALWAHLFRLERTKLFWRCFGAILGFFREKREKIFFLNAGDTAPLFEHFMMLSKNLAVLKIILSETVWWSLIIWTVGFATKFTTLHLWGKSPELLTQLRDLQDNEQSILWEALCLLIACLWLFIHLQPVVIHNSSARH